MGEKNIMAKHGVATVLAIGTANPPNCFYQKDYPDFYFKVTQSEHLKELKDKFKRICERTAINKRYMRVTEDTIKKNPNIGIYKAPSLDARQEILVPEVPKLGQEAASNAIKEWGQPVSKITHLIFCTSSGMNMPSADHELMKLLGLHHSVKRFMIYFQGCFAAGTALRLAKDVAENNLNSRILIVCSENTAMWFHAPSDTHLDILIGSAIFGDGAAAVIIGANPDLRTEHPLFELVSASQMCIPESENAIMLHVREMGMSYYLSRSVPLVIKDYIGGIMSELFDGIGIKDWNSLFYVVHAGGQAIFNGIEEKLGLVKEKLRASRNVLSEYGNMGGPSVLFALDEIRKLSFKERKASTGEGFEFGVLLAFGPGLTVESVILRSIATADK